MEDFLAELRDRKEKKRLERNAKQRARYVRNERSSRAFGGVVVTQRKKSKYRKDDEPGTEMKPAGPLTSPDVVNNGAFLSAGTSPSVVIAEHDYSSCRVAGDSTAGTHQAMRFRNSARDEVHMKWKHSDKSSTRAHRIKKMKNLCMKLHRDSKAEILLLVRVPNQSVATERAFLYGDGVVQLMHTEMGQQFYHQFMSLPKPVVEDHRSGSINDDDEPVMVLPDDRP